MKLSPLVPDGSIASIGTITTHATKSGRPPTTFDMVISKEADRVINGSIDDAMRAAGLLSVAQPDDSKLKGAPFAMGVFGAGEGAFLLRAIRHRVEGGGALTWVGPSPDGPSSFRFASIPVGRAGKDGLLAVVAGTRSTMTDDQGVATLDFF